VPPKVDLGAELAHAAGAEERRDERGAREVPRGLGLRREIATHFLKRGQYSRALEDLKGYEKAIMELASARALQRFVSPRSSASRSRSPPEPKGEKFLMMALGAAPRGQAGHRAAETQGGVNNDAYPPTCSSCGPTST
jgi:hypothetical protein